MASIKINEKEYPVRWGLCVFQTFCDKTKVPVDRIMSDTYAVLQENLLYKVDLLFEALKYGSKREGIDFDLTWDDVEAWFSDNPGSSAAFIEAWREQSPPPVDDKKKAKKGQS